MGCPTILLRYLKVQAKITPFTHVGGYEGLARQKYRKMLGVLTVSRKIFVRIESEALFHFRFEARPEPGFSPEAAKTSDKNGINNLIRKIYMNSGRSGSFPDKKTSQSFIISTKQSEKARGPLAPFINYFSSSPSFRKEQLPPIERKSLLNMEPAESHAADFPESAHYRTNGVPQLTADVIFH